jgi:hypothetical protein
MRTESDAGLWITTHRLYPRAVSFTVYCTIFHLLLRYFRKLSKTATIPVFICIHVAMSHGSLLGPNILLSTLFANDMDGQRISKSKILYNPDFYNISFTIKDKVFHVLFS